MIKNGQYEALAKDFKTCTNLTDEDDRYQVGTFVKMC